MKMERAIHPLILNFTPVFMWKIVYCVILLVKKVLFPVLKGLYIHFIDELYISVAAFLLSVVYRGIKLNVTCLKS